MSRARDFADLAGSADAGGLTGRNLIINGSMAIAQRGTSSTSTGYQTVDRFQANFAQVSVTSSQQSLSSGDPYNDGFRNFFRLANTSVSSATDAYAQFEYLAEAQDIAKSGWQYASSSSSITLSFWARSSLAGTYYAMLRTFDTAEYLRIASFTLVADTWKKVSISVAGNSNLVFNNDNGQGLNVLVVPHYGTTYTGGEEVSTTDWYSRASQTDAYFPDYAQNWSNTASATFDLTGVQLEVGDKATPFEHRSYGDELARCQRYFFKQESVSGSYPPFGFGTWFSASRFISNVQFPVPMRANPSVTITGDVEAWDGTSPKGAIASVGIESSGGGDSPTIIKMDATNLSGATSGNHGFLMADNDSNASLEYSAEL